MNEKGKLKRSGQGKQKKIKHGKLYAKEPGGEHSLHAAKKPETFGESNVVSRRIQKRNTQKQMMQRAQMFLGSPTASVQSAFGPTGIHAEIHPP